MAGNPNGRTYLSLIQSSDNFPYDVTSGAYYQLFLPHDEQPHGYLLPETVRKMPWTSHFRVDHSAPRSVTVLDASLGEDTPGAVNTAFSELVDICIERDLFHIIDGKHSEPVYIVSAKYPVRVERFASALFGVTLRGAYIMVYTRASDGALKLWIPRRAAHLYTSPGLLDAAVAGGIKAGTTPLETAVQEAFEEASLPEDLVRERVRSAGALTYISTTTDPFPGEKGLVIPNIIYVYDLELPGNVVPKPNDDEVQEFYLMAVPDVQRALLDGEFKPDSAVMIIDFLIRHGILTADNEEDLVEITTRLHRRLPFRTR
ncbi:NUDIX hydrolase domain-like protein [Durotheca rogersii]|uniref:NUDIX hydrolase domain-like protein n=1 Tax=Durotheca rogersii TaxID=419775 RepID=UPI00221F1223|nr:NUDIX hydrolase domain-like protein [Durotheca rogersii]KAI5864331.1 NUDIX hydrolase domain-like protein [Durotheca rogersii]